MVDVTCPLAGVNAGDAWRAGAGGLRFPAAAFLLPRFGFGFGFGTGFGFGFGAVGFGLVRAAVFGFTAGRFELGVVV
jgi:hypothetical protein